MRQIGTVKDGCPEIDFMGQRTPFAKGGAVKHTPPAHSGTVPSDPPVLDGTVAFTPLAGGGAILHTPPAPGRPKRSVRTVKKYSKECYLIYTIVFLFEGVLGVICCRKSKIIFIFENG